MSSVLHALMPNTYVMLMAQASRDPEGLVAGSGLSLSDILHKDEPITVRQQLICARNAVAMMARPDWHLAWAETVGEHFVDRGTGGEERIVERLGHEDTSLNIEHPDAARELQALVDVAPAKRTAIDGLVRVGGEKEPIGGRHHPYARVAF